MRAIKLSLELEQLRSCDIAPLGDTLSATNRPRRRKFGRDSMLSMFSRAPNQDGSGQCGPANNRFRISET